MDNIHETGPSVKGCDSCNSDDEKLMTEAQAQVCHAASEDWHNEAKCLYAQRKAAKAEERRALTKMYRGKGFRFFDNPLTGRKCQDIEEYALAYFDYNRRYIQDITRGTECEAEMDAFADRQKCAQKSEFVHISTLNLSEHQLSTLALIKDVEARFGVYQEATARSLAESKGKKSVPPARIIRQVAEEWGLISPRAGVKSEKSVTEEGPENTIYPSNGFSQYPSDFGSFKLKSNHLTYVRIDPVTGNLTVGVQWRGSVFTAGITDEEFQRLAEAKGYVRSEPTATQAAEPEAPPLADSEPTPLESPTPDGILSEEDVYALAYPEWFEPESVRGEEDEDDPIKPAAEPSSRRPARIDPALPLQLWMTLLKPGVVVGTGRNRVRIVSEPDRSAYLVGVSEQAADQTPRRIHLRTLDYEAISYPAAGGVA